MERITQMIYDNTDIKKLNKSYLIITIQRHQRSIFGG